MRERREGLLAFTIPQLYDESYDQSCVPVALLLSERSWLTC
jgi:hypothetical protein